MTNLDELLEWDEGVSLYVRRGTHDAKSARECPKLVERLDVRSGDLVLDVGGHIGAFAAFCQRRGAYVITVEPEPSNVELLRRNVPQARVVQAAVVSDGRAVAEPTVPLYVRGVTHTGLHTLIPGRTEKTMRSVVVEAVGWRHLLDGIRPTVLKVDIEGGEWALDWTNLPASVRALHLEMHMIPKDAGGRERAPVVHRQLLDQGFTATVLPNFNVMWGTHPIYLRSDLPEVLP